MNEKTFNLIDAVNREGIDNSVCGLGKDIVDTSSYFGTTESIELCGMYLYIYRKEETDYSFIDKIQPDFTLRLSDSKDEFLELYKID